MSVAAQAEARSQQVLVIASNASTLDGKVVAAFAAGPLRKLSGFLDRLLTLTRPDSFAALDEMVADLAAELEPWAGASRLGGGLPGWMARLLLSRRLRRAHGRDAVGRLRAIADRAAAEASALTEGGAALERLIPATAANLQEIDVWVEGGLRALDRWRGGGGDAAMADLFSERLARMDTLTRTGQTVLPALREADTGARDAGRQSLDAIASEIPGVIVATGDSGQATARDERAALARALLARLRSLQSEARAARALRDEAAQRLGALRIEVLAAMHGRPAAMAREGFGTDVRG